DERPAFRASRYRNARGVLGHGALLRLERIRGDERQYDEQEKLHTASVAAGTAGSPNQSRALPLISRQSPRLVRAQHLSGALRAPGPVCGPTTSTRFAFVAA